MFKIPSGSNSSRTSGGIKTPKLARTPQASGCSVFMALTVVRSDLVRA